MEKIKRLLSEYKQARLRVFDNGIWKKNQQAYPHILPENLRYLNIIEIFRKEFWDYWGENQLHPDFHHLNSSQALCFNLFFPLTHYAANHSEISLRKYGLELSSKAKFIFEHILDSEEGTNIDLFHQNSKDKTLFEIKFTETGFGAGGKNEKFDTYMKLLDKVLMSRPKDEQFYENYQFYRYLSYVAKGFRVFIIYPKFNIHISETESLVKDMIVDGFENRVRFIPLEDFLSDLRVTDFGKANHLLQAHYTLLAEKYCFEA